MGLKEKLKKYCILKKVRESVNDNHKDNPEPKYQINIDFPDVSRVHLNQDLFETAGTCRIQEKRNEDGGWERHTTDEVKGLLDGTRQLKWNGKPVKNLEICKTCAKLEDYDFSNHT